MRKKILITGAAGFIGSYLFKDLSKKGYNVIGLDNFDHPCGAKIKCIKGDVRDFDLVDRLVKKVDIVYHLAAQINVDRSYKQKRLTFDTNVNGTKNILEACRKYSKKMIFASTSEVYGTAKNKLISENHPLNPQSPYALSKKIAEDLCKKYVTEYGVQVIILRNFNTYGPYQNMNFYGAVIPVFLKRVLNNQQPEVYLPGTQTRDFMYIEDAIRAYNLAARKAPIGEPINFGTGKETSIFKLAKIIIKLAGSRLNPTYIKGRPNEVMRLRADISKAKKLGFKPKVSLLEGLKRYKKWLKSSNNRFFL
jgi:UDP-glucose 4-epimerase